MLSLLLLIFGSTQSKAQNTSSSQLFVHVTNLRSLAKDLARDLHRPVVLIISRRQDLSTVTTGETGLPWSDYRHVLVSAGFLVFQASDGKALCIVQERPYLASSVVTPPSALHQQEWDMIRDLSKNSDADDQQNLFSDTGITAATVGELPAALRSIYTQLIAVSPEKWPVVPRTTRVHIKICPSIDLAFVPPPQKLAASWWRWSPVYPGGDPSLPPSLAAKAAVGVPTNLLPSGSITYAMLAKSLSISGWKLNITSGVQLPSIEAAGTGVTSRDVFEAIRAAALQEIRMSRTKKLALITSPAALNTVIAGLWMSRSDFGLFKELYNSTCKRYQLTLDGIANGMYLMPLNAYDQKWTTLILSGSSDAPGAASAGARAPLSIWQKEYHNSSALLIPGLAIDVSFEELSADKADTWIPLETTEDSIRPISK
jgi:hypothetical protein